MSSGLVVQVQHDSLICKFTTRDFSPEKCIFLNIVMHVFSHNTHEGFTCRDDYINGRYLKYIMVRVS